MEQFERFAQASARVEDLTATLERATAELAKATEALQLHLNAAERSLARAHRRQAILTIVWTVLAVLVVEGLLHVGPSVLQRTARLYDGSPWSPPGKPGAPLPSFLDSLRSSLDRLWTSVPSGVEGRSLGTTPRQVGGDIPSEEPQALAGARVEGSAQRALPTVPSGTPQEESQPDTQPRIFRQEPDLDELSRALGPILRDARIDVAPTIPAVSDDEQALAIAAPFDEPQSAREGTTPPPVTP